MTAEAATQVMETMVAATMATAAETTAVEIRAPEVKARAVIPEAEAETVTETPEGVMAVIAAAVTAQEAVTMEMVVPPETQSAITAEAVAMVRAAAQPVETVMDPEVAAMPEREMPAAPEIMQAQETVTVSL